MIRSDVKKGLIDALPIILGYFSASIAFGMLARSGGLTLWESQAFSLFTFTGAAQFMALNLLAAGASAPQIAISYALLNMRYLLMSAAVAKKINFTHFLQRPLLAFGVTDEIFAITTGNPGHVTPAYQAVAEASSWLGWNAGTLCGWLFGSLVPPGLGAAMISSLYALFMALLLPDLKKGWPWIITAASAGVLNTILEMGTSLGSGWSFVIAMIGGTLLGMTLIPEDDAWAEEAL